MSQAQAIVAYMTMYGSITSKEAEERLGVMRLASRIHDLKREGYHITYEWEQVKTRYGNGTTRVKRYYMGGQNV